MANGYNGLVIIDIQNPNEPVYAGEYYTEGVAIGVDISGHYAYVANKDNGLGIIDIQNPSGPVYVGGYNTEGYAIDVAISGHYAYVVDGYHLVIIDIQDPNRPVYVGECSTKRYAYGVTISGHYAYVADGENGLGIIDIQDPNEPVYAGGYGIGRWAYGVAISGHYAYLADRASGDNGLVIIDVQNPNIPVYAGRYNTVGEVNDVAISGHYAYVADEVGGLLIFQIIDTPPSQGNLILCPSGPAYVSNPLWSPSQVLSNIAYSTFMDQNYPHYFTYYLTPNPNQDVDQDGLPDPLAVDDLNPTLADINSSLTDWAYNRLNTGPLYLYLTGLGTEDAFQIMPGEILKASDPGDSLNPDNPDTLEYSKPSFDPSLKYSLDRFQSDPNRDVICLLEFSSSGSFCDDLIDPNTPAYSRTIITCTDSDSSYLDQSGQLAFTGQLLNLLQDSNQQNLPLLNLLQDSNQQNPLSQEFSLPYSTQSPQPNQLSGLFSNTGISHEQRVHLLQSLFSQARDNFWASGYPFNTQPPQMVTAQGPHTLCRITLSPDPLISTTSDPLISTTSTPLISTTSTPLSTTSSPLISTTPAPPKPPAAPLITDQSQLLSLKATGHYLDGDLDLTDQVYFQSSDESILKVTQTGEVFVNPDTTYNGKATILATIIDPDFTQSQNHSSPSHSSLNHNPDLPDLHDLPPLGGVTGRITINVDIPGRGEKEGLPLAIIVAGEKEKQDNLWAEIHTITHYAYRTLLGRGYSRERIIYLTHLQEELLLADDPGSGRETDLDGDGNIDNDIDGLPSLASLKEALDRVKEKGTDSLILFLASHGVNNESGLLSSGGIYLSSPTQNSQNPTQNSQNILTPQTLDLWLDDLQAHNRNLAITIIIESCHSGLFMQPLSPTDEQKRIIMTSTEEGTSYLYAHGLVSFSYYLFTHLQSGASFEAAYDNARQSILEIDNFLSLNRQLLNEDRQRPQLSERRIARSCSLGGSFLISQDQPVITSATLFPDPNAIPIGKEITLQVRASDLDGIDPNGVWAFINATYSPPAFSGNVDQPIIDLPRIDLSLTENGVYEGKYPGFSYAGPYSFLIFAQDKKGTVSIPYTLSLNVTGDEQNRALLITGYAPSSYLSPLISHAQWVLSEKRYSQIQNLTTPSIADLEQEIKNLAYGAHQLFIYFIGQTKTEGDKTQLLINQNQTLDPDTFNQWLDGLKCTVIFLLDASLNLSSPFEHTYNHTFLQPGLRRINITGSLTGTPYWDQGGYCAFSHFFFTCLYWGATVYQAYEYSIKAIDYYSYQEPFLHDGVASNELAKATYLGSPFVIETAGPRITGYLFNNSG